MHCADGVQVALKCRCRPQLIRVRRSGKVCHATPIRLCRWRASQRESDDVFDACRHALACRCLGDAPGSPASPIRAQCQLRARIGRETGRTREVPHGYLSSPGCGGKFGAFAAAPMPLASSSYQPGGFVIGHATSSCHENLSMPVRGQRKNSERIGNAQLIVDDLPMLQVL